MGAPLGQDAPVMAPGVYTYQPLGYHQYTATSAALDLTDSASFTIPAGARVALIAVSGGKIRYRDDGTKPTSGLGIPVDATSNIQEFQYTGDLSAFQFILSSGSPVLDVLYYK